MSTHPLPHPHRDTLPHQLKKQRATSTRMFALCFRVGGGIMTLGGVEQKIHSKPGVSYAKLLSKDGWFQVSDRGLRCTPLIVDSCFVGASRWPPRICPHLLTPAPAGHCPCPCLVLHCLVR